MAIQWWIKIFSGSMTTCTFTYASKGCHPKDIKCVQISFKTRHNSPLKWCKALLGWQARLPHWFKVLISELALNSEKVMAKQKTLCRMANCQIYHQYISWTPLISNGAQFSVNSDTPCKPRELFKSNCCNNSPLCKSNKIII